MRLNLALIIIALLAAPSFGDDSSPADSRGVESLGNELLEGLVPNSGESPAPPSNNEDPNQPRDPVTIAPRFDDLGEDIGQPRGALSLERVRVDMQRAQSMIAAKNAAAGAPDLKQAGDVQQQVVAQLDKLIAELSKQCKNCQGSSSSSSQSQTPKQASQKKPGGKSSTMPGRGQTAARDSTDRLGPANRRLLDQGDVERMVKDLWGHLPERSREQMIQSFSEEFLPEYELEIEEYYRRLSEDDEIRTD
jgi:hypothetical protein